MDFMDPGPLMSGAAISMVGMGLLVHGKKSENLISLGTGLAMVIFPMFVHSILLMWVIAVGCIAGHYTLSRLA